MPWLQYLWTTYQNTVELVWVQNDVTLPNAGFTTWVNNLASNFPVVHDNPTSLLWQYLAATDFTGSTVSWPQIFIVGLDGKIQKYLSGPSDIPNQATFENQLVDVLNPRNSINLDLVMDVSDSMNSPAPSNPSGDSKYAMMKQASKIIIDLFHDHGQADDKVGLTWFTDNASEYSDPITSEKLVTVQNHSASLKAEIDIHPTGNCTAMGAGLQTAFNKLSAVPNSRLCIVCTDGMQNIEPKVTNVGGHFEIIDSGGWLCDGHSSTPPNPGYDITNYNTHVQTIGIGIEATYASLLQDLATATDGFYLGTNDPDVDLDLLYYVDLCNCMVGSSPEVVFHKVGRLHAEQNTNDVHFYLNRSVRKITAILSWQKSQNNPLHFWLFTPNGIQIPLMNTIRYSDTYMLATVYLPMGLPEANEHVGQWRMRIFGDLNKPFVDYHAAVIAEDREIQFHVDFQRKLYFVGDILQLNLHIKELDRLIQKIMDIDVETASLVDPLPEIISKYKISNYELKEKAKQFAEYPEDPVMLKLIALSANPEYQKILKPVRKTFSLSKGTLKPEFTNREIRIPIKLTQAGLITIKLMIQAETSKNGPVQRVDLVSVLVNAGDPDPKHTIITEITRETDKIHGKLLRVTPKTKSGHLLGPGRAGEFKSMIANNFQAVKVSDLLDGSYEVEIASPEDQVAKSSKKPTKVALWYGEKVIWG